jgi:flagellar motor switch/type III secretory pathway protein FliN
MVSAMRDQQVEMTVALGLDAAHAFDLSHLHDISLIDLSRKSGGELQISVNGHAIACGQLVVSGDGYAIRLTRILPPENRLTLIDGA